MKRIGVIEDDPDNRLILAMMLEQQFHVDAYEDAESALQGMHLQQPDLVLIDITLPDMNGVELLAKIRANPSLRHIRTIAVTGLVSRGEEEKYTKLGFDDCLAKPIMQQHELIRKVNNCLESVPNDE